MVCIMKPYGEVVASPYEIHHTEPEVAKLSHNACLHWMVRSGWSWRLPEPIICHCCVLCYRPPEELYADLKLLGRQYQHYISLSVMSLNSLTHLLDGVMPGIKALLRTTNGDRKKRKLCDFVEEFWHFDQITKMGQQRFINTYCRWAKKKDTIRTSVRRRKSTP